MISLGILVVSACSRNQPVPVVKQSLQNLEPVNVQKQATPVTKEPELSRTTKSVPKPVPKGVLTSIDMGRVFAMNQTGDIQLIDVRPSLFYRLGHIDDAENMALIKYDKIIDLKRPLLDSAVKSGKVIVLYCQNVDCPDAHKMGLKLAELGYSASIYHGGWEEWKEAGL